MDPVTSHASRTFTRRRARARRSVEANVARLHLVDSRVLIGEPRRLPGVGPRIAPEPRRQDARRGPAVAVPAAAERPRWRGVGLGWIVSAALHVSIAGALAFLGVAPREAPPPPETIAVALVAAGAGGTGVNAVEESDVAQPPSPPPAPRKKRIPRPRPAPVVAAEPVIPEPVADTAVVTPAEEVEVPPTESADDAHSEDTADTALAGVAGESGGSAQAGVGAGASDGTGGDGIAAGSPFGTLDPPIDAKLAMVAPRAIRRTPPEYPRQARSAGIEGLVVLRAIVDRDGRIEPDHLRVLRSVPALDEAALEAVRTWRFSPALDENRRPVRVLVNIPVRFSLR